MSDAVRVKICGLTRPEHVAATVASGAAYIGFVFFPKSPRNVTPVQARALALDVPPGVAKVALTVNASDADLDEILSQAPIDLLQLQGAETPKRVAEVRARTGLPVMKAIGIGTPDDLSQIARYATVADQLLIDAKPPKDAALPGGNGVTFDWSLIAGQRWPVPWMLAGGLTDQNVAQAVAQTGARQVDVSSAVESEPGLKSPDKVAAFIAAAQQA